MEPSAGDAAPRRRKRVLVKLGLLLGSLLVTLLLAEGALRLAGMRPPRLSRQLTEDVYIDRDPPLEWVLKPSQEVHTQYYGDAYGPDRLVIATVNELGWRGPAVTREKPADTLRIACVGDSLTFGFGVQDDDTWPAQLERELGEGAQVLNWGVNGYDTLQEITLFEERVDEYAPDLLLVAFFTNDAHDADAAKPDPITGWRVPVLSLVGPKPIAPARWLRSVSWLADLSSQAISRQIVWLRRAGAERLYFQEGNPGWDEVRAALRQGRDLCAARGARMLMVLYPPLQRRGAQLTAVEVYPIVAEFCRSEGIACLDLSEAFADQPVETMWVHSLDMHPNAQANAIAAAAIAERLRADGLLGPR